MNLNIVIFGLSLSSFRNNDQATTWRALVKALAARRHRVTFLERDSPAFRGHRDLADPRWCHFALYGSLAEVAQRFGRTVRNADLVILGSRVPDGTALGEWITAEARGVTAFHAFDTPEMIEGMLNGSAGCPGFSLIPRFDFCFSTTGGPILRMLERHLGSPRARPLHCAVDTDEFRPRRHGIPEWDLGWAGPWSADRRPLLEQLLLEPARRLPHLRFIVACAGADDIDWPRNVKRVEPVPPAQRADVYGKQRFTLCLAPAAMKRAGFSPGPELVEAAACATAVISDRWRGIENVLEPGREILLAGSADDVIGILTGLSEPERAAIGAAACERAARNHSGHRRAIELEGYVRRLISERRAAPAEARVFVPAGLA